MRKTNLIISIRLLLCLIFLLIIRTNLTAQLPVELSYFSASFYEYFPHLNWGTASETNNAGWNIYRSESGNIQDSIQVNPILIPGAGTTIEPIDYEYIDRHPVYPEQTYWYWLESVSESGETLIFGPITIVIPDYMPVVIVNFLADFYDDFVSISWSTEFESNVCLWHIYRCDNGNIEDIIYIGMIEGCNCPADYEFTDDDIELNQTYWYWIECVFLDGSSHLYGYVSVYTGNISVGEEVTANSRINLYQNYPNPFNPITTISFSIPIKSKVVLEICNFKGQKVKTLLNSEFTKGNHSIFWEGVDESGKKVSSGVYLYNLKVNGKSKAVKKCLLLK